jgi:hypothetical protein
MSRSRDALQGEVTRWQEAAKIAQQGVLKELGHLGRQITQLRDAPTTTVEGRPLMTEDATRTDTLRKMILSDLPKLLLVKQAKMLEDAEQAHLQQLRSLLEEGGSGGAVAHASVLHDDLKQIVDDSVGGVGRAVARLQTNLQHDFRNLFDSEVAEELRLLKASSGVVYDAVSNVRDLLSNDRRPLGDGAADTVQQLTRVVDTRTQGVVDSVAALLAPDSALGRATVAHTTLDEVRTLKRDVLALREACLSQSSSAATASVVATNALARPAGTPTVLAKSRSVTTPVASAYRGSPTKAWYEKGPRQGGTDTT